MVLYAVLQLWRADFHIQFRYRGDSLWYAVLTKSIVQNGWTYFVPQLSAPEGLDAAAFPSMTHVDWLLMKVLSGFIADPAVVFNLFWLLTIAVTGWTCLLSLRLLGVPPWFASVGGLLYTCIPFTWIRSPAHLSLVFYSVPFLCVYAVYLVRGPVDPWSDASYRRVGIIGGLLQGFNYVYFSWFAMLLFGVAGVLGYVHRRDASVLRWVVVGIATVAMAVVLNLAPSFYSWHTHGAPNIGFKTLSKPN